MAGDEMRRFLAEGTALMSSRESSQMTFSSSQVVVLEVIRGIAALAVALLHVREINWIGMREFIELHGIRSSPLSIVAYASLPLAWGSIGVPIFFVLSGYVIHRGSRMRLISYDAAIGFLCRRFVRIYPVFIAALIVTALCDSWSAEYCDHTKHGDLSPANAIMNICGLVGIIGSPYGSNVALWSLPIEIQLYCVYPIALVAWRRIGPSRMMILATVVTMLGIALQLMTGIVSAVTYFAPWWLGAFVADRESHAKCWRFQRAAGLTLLAIGCVACSNKYGLASHMAWSLGFALLLEKIIRTPRLGFPVPLLRALTLCGAVSYSLYAIHMPVAVAFNAATLGGAKSESIMWTIVAMIPVMLVACLVYMFVERPSNLRLAAMRAKDCD